ncbi:MAG: YbaB/EbfC family nucleoid-associated protein [Bacilli bacterium]
MNQQAMIRKLKKMQDEMMATQEDINHKVFTASSGGIVTVEVYGTKEIKSVKISDSFDGSDKEDYEMLGDMVVAACNDAYKHVDAETKDRMGKYQSLLGGMGGGLF